MRQPLEHAIFQLENHRALLGEAVVETAIQALREKLASGLEDTHQRKQVTILLANLTGFKQLSDNLEAEEVLTLMNNIWGDLDAIINQHGGRIDKHVGNSVTAIWGIGISREDDPEQAVLAALQLREKLPAHIPLRLRIGIHTGYAVLGKLGSTGEFIALGHSIKLATLLEEAAEPDSILITHDTYRHIRGIFDVEKHMPLLAVGQSPVTNTYRVLALKPRPFHITSRGVEGIEPRLIGRAMEFEALQQALLALPTSHSVKIISIVGEAGVGKSRLLMEFLDWAELLTDRTVWLFRARAHEHSQNTPYSLLRGLLALRFDIKRSDPAELAREKLVREITTFLGADSTEKAHFIGHLIGMNFADSPYLSHILTDIPQLRTRAFQYLAELFRAVHFYDDRRDPLLFLLEDMHWADDSSLAALYHIALFCHDVPMLMVGTARPSLFDRHPRHAHHVNYGTILELHPLSPTDSQRLLADILQKLPHPPPALCDLIIQRAEGNPFYMEEMVKMLIDERIISTEGDLWHAYPERLQEFKLPSTLAGVLQTRFDYLSAPEKYLLQQASVVGRIFWDAALYHLNPHLPPTQVQTILDQLCEREFIYRRKGSLINAAEEYIFKHVLLREFIYNNILRAQRRAYHQQVGDWLVSLSGERLTEYAERIATHYEEAGEQQLAVDYLYRAGEQAYQTSAYPQALLFYERALAYLADTDPHCATLLYSLGRTRGNLGDFNQAHAYFKQALALPALAPTLQANLLTALGVLASRQGALEEAEGYLAEAQQLAQHHDNRLSLAFTLRHQSSLAHLRGNYAHARALAQTALDHYRALHNLMGITSTLMALGNAHSGSGDFAAAEQAYQEGLLMAQNSGDRAGASILLLHLGEAAQQQQKYPQAQHYFAESLRLAEEIGHQPTVAANLLNQGTIALALGHERAAEAYLREALGLFQAMHMPAQSRAVLHQWAVLLYQRGDLPHCAQLVDALEHPLLAKLPPERSLPPLTQEDLITKILETE